MPKWIPALAAAAAHTPVFSGDSYTLGQSVNSKTGIVIYPDNYTGSVYSGSDWTTFEAAGCVFLPAAGYRNGSNLDAAVQSLSDTTGRHRPAALILAPTKCGSVRPN